MQFYAGGLRSPKALVAAGSASLDTGNIAEKHQSHPKKELANRWIRLKVSRSACGGHEPETTCEILAKYYPHCLRKIYHI